MMLTTGKAKANEIEKYNSLIIALPQPIHYRIYIKLQ